MPTTNASLPYLSQGQSQKETTYNSLADIADDLFYVRRGLLSARPAASRAGRLYFVTDAGSEALYQDTGSVWAVVLLGPASLSVGIRNTHETFRNVLAISFTNVRAAVAANSGTYTTAITNPDVPRSISINFVNTTGGALSTTSDTVVLVGVNAQGVATTENVTLTGTSVGAGASQSLVTSNPFATITSVQLGVSQPAGFNFNLGGHNHFGLARPVASVYKVKRNQTDETASGHAISTTFGTVQFIGVGAGDDLAIWYRSA